MEKIDRLENKKLHARMNCNGKDIIIFHYFCGRFILDYRNKIIFEKSLKDHLINKKYSYFILMIKMLSVWRQYARKTAKWKIRQRAKLRKASVEA